MKIAEKEGKTAQVEEFKDVESPLGFKIPKMPGSTDDLSNLIGLGDKKEEVLEEMPSLEDLGRQGAAGGGGGVGGAPAVGVPGEAAPAGGGMFGGGLFGARRQ